MEQPEFTVESQDLTSSQQQMVRETLRSILESPYFCKSKRYPALLEYAVCSTLDGNSNLLKERTIGTEVFGRPADYDSTCDPIVRIAALEVRKRIELYFIKHPDAPVRIELYAGSYIAKFHFRAPSANDTPSEEPQADIEEVQDSAASDATPPESKSKRRRTWVAGLGAVLATALLLMVAGAAVWHYYVHGRAKREFWWSVLHNDVPAVIVMGEGPDASLTAGTSGQDLKPLVMENAIVTAQICSVFRKYARDCKITPAQSATLEDLHGKSVVLVGAFDNEWTQRLMAPLRYQFQYDESGPSTPPRARMIADRGHTGSVSTWRVGPNGPSPELGDEFAIVGRFRSDITDGTVVVAAGIGPTGTSSAGEYVCTPEKLREILSLAPKDWKGFNFEAVLQIEVVQGHGGHVKVAATQFW
jgi:hypothetical protein